MENGALNLPPAGCTYQANIKTVHGVAALELETATINISAAHLNFYCQNGGLSKYCGSDLTDKANILKVMQEGDIENFDSTLILTLEGTGTRADFKRTIILDNVPVKTETGPRDPTAPYQDFETQIRSIQASLPPGDPDIAFLQVTAGVDNGLPPSPGHTTAVQYPEGHVLIESFFDVTFDIVLTGAPGGLLDGVPETTSRETVTLEVPDGELLIDGFESGDVTLWSDSCPPNCPVEGK